MYLFVITNLKSQAVGKVIEVRNYGLQKFVEKAFELIESIKTYNFHIPCSATNTGNVPVYISKCPIDK